MIEDKYPGRCLCARFNANIGDYERCLGYEATSHVCTFPKTAMPAPVIMIHAKIKPDPWVAPEGSYDKVSSQTEGES